MPQEMETALGMLLVGLFMLSLLATPAVVRQSGSISNGPPPELPPPIECPRCGCPEAFELVNATDRRCGLCGHKKGRPVSPPPPPPRRIA